MRKDSDKLQVAILRLSDVAKNSILDVYNYVRKTLRGRNLRMCLGVDFAIPTQTNTIL
jgi:hypothetical protein